MSLYYREKVLKLHEKLFLTTGTTKNRFLRSEKEFDAIRVAYKSAKLPENVLSYWSIFFNEVDTYQALYDNKGRLIYSSFTQYIINRRAKTFEKYLEFILSEFFRILNPIPTHF